MRQITKRFPGILANDRVDFEVRPGEVHALLGENGAGKSTLMSVLTGLYRPDEGEIRLDGRPVEFRSPRDAITAGIGMVHQHFKLVAPFTVAENVILGLREPRFRLRMDQVEARVAEVSAQYGLKVDPAARIWQLSVGEQQRVEIVKLLYRGAQVLILDEPTAVLTPQESAALFRTLRQMAARGHGVVVITHKMHEVMAVADRVTVLRGGRLIGSTTPQETGPRELAEVMVGRPLAGRGEKAAAAAGAPVLMVTDLRVPGDRGVDAVRGLSLELRAGEILGLAGVAGNGQRELGEALAGLRRVTGGRIQVGDRDVTNRSPRAVMDAGLCLIPEDRLGMGLVGNLDLADNAILKEYRQAPVSRRFLLDRKAAVERARELVHRFEVKAAGIDIPVKLLSGGNAQKLLLGRELRTGPRVVIAMNPVRGLDVGATESIHRILLEQRAAGTGILLVSEDLDELLALSDRICVIYEGRIMGVVDAEAADVHALGLMMAGQRPGEVAAG